MDHHSIIQHLILNENEIEIMSKKIKLYIECSDEKDAPAKQFKKRRANIERNRVRADAQLFDDYFAEDSTYTDEQFRRRFRMDRPLFKRIVAAVTEHDSYFVQKTDAAKKVGFSSFQKVSVALRMLAYGVPADSLDESFRMAESTVLKCVRRFCAAVIAVFGKECLRSPNDEDVKHLLKEGEERGLPGMLGSLNCIHWEWKNCPVSWHSLYVGKEKVPTIILEAVASKDLWIWPAFFGLPGSLNDINVLDRSDLFEDLADGKGPRVDFSVNGHQYNMGYYMTDGIYPSYAAFVKSFHDPRTAKQKLFTKVQEAVRKDVERAFGVLQGRFAIVAGPARMWSNRTLHNIMTTCIILHNMIVEFNRQNGIADELVEAVRESVSAGNSIVYREQSMPEGTFGGFMHNYLAIRNREAHFQLRNDLMENLWRIEGERQ